MTLDDIAQMPWFAELPPDDTIGWRNVSQTHLSLARLYGGAKVNRHSYTYMPASDELIRDDILKRAIAWRKAQDKAELQAQRDAAQAAQGRLL